MTTPTFTARTGDANPLNGFVVGTFSNPAFGDVDNDGDLDLVAGVNDGTFAWYENTGTASAPAFTARTGDARPAKSPADRTEWPNQRVRRVARGDRIA